MKRVLIIAVLLCLTACGNFKTNHYANINHLTGKVKDKYLKNKSQYFPEYKTALDCTSSCEGKYKDYRDMGVYLVKSACEDQLDSLAVKHRNHNAAKDIFIASSLLATGIMGVNGVGGESFERLALGSVFTISMFDIRENYYLLGPDRIEIINMIRSGLVKITNATLQNDTLTFEDAYSQIRDVAYICTNNQIDALVRESLIKGKEAIQVSPIVDAQLIASYNKISEILNTRPLSDNQHLGMYAYVKLGEKIDAVTGSDTNGLKALLGVYATAGNVPTSDQARKIAEVYSRFPRALHVKMLHDYNKVKADAMAAANAAVSRTLNSSDVDFTLPNFTSSSLTLEIPN
ncbi:hypothetical protein WKI13_18680 [Teredinibacter turnerae]|uniref:hypothetical protein n=1 Tax=Teredinibacter turnerae TaxID=2426 RepID=UPI0003624BC2|nr:hypothetical protein [Teredinibacter turnerae]